MTAFAANANHYSIKAKGAHFRITAGLTIFRRAGPRTQPLFDAAQAARHCQLVGIDPVLAHLRAIPWQGGNATPLPPTARPRTKQLEQLQQKGNRLYLIAGSAKKDEEVTSIPAVFAEWDGVLLEEVLAFVHEAQVNELPEHHLMLTTWKHGSAHIWWRLAEPCTDIPRWKRLMDRLVIALGSDPVCVNPSRLMRLAGSSYIATESKHPGKGGQVLGQATIIYEDDDLDHCTRLEDLEAWVNAEFTRRPELSQQQREVRWATNRGEGAFIPPADADRRSTGGKILEPRSLAEIKAALACIPKRVSGARKAYSHPYHRFILIGLRDALYRLTKGEQAKRIQEANRQAYELMEAHSPPKESGWDVAQQLRSSFWLGEGCFWKRAAAEGHNLRMTGTRRKKERAHAQAAQPGAAAGHDAEKGAAIHEKDETPIDLLAAQILQKESGHTIACHQDAFFIYNPAAGYWSRVSADAMKRRALDVLKRIYVMVKLEDIEFESFKFGSARQVDDTVRSLRSVAGPGPLDRRSPPHVVVFSNGTFNLRTNTLEPHNSDHGATYAVAGPFVPDALCPPEVERIIARCFPDGAEVILRAMFRWVIDPTVPYGQAFHLLGGTGTGKGLVLTLVQSLLPSELVSALSHPADLKGPEQLYQFALGRRLMLFPDCPAKMPRYAEHLGPWYELAENKPQSLRRLHGSDTDACRLHCRSIIASITPLKLSDSRDGAQRRLLTLESLPRGGEPDPTLLEDISGNTNRQRQMLGELASWALLMPLDEVNDVLAKNDSGGLLRESAAAVAAEGDTVAMFIDACLVPITSKPDAEVRGADVEVTDADWKHMFTTYLGWCKAVNVTYGMQFSNFQGQVRRTLGVDRCLPRVKESRTEARAAGREPAERLNLVRFDAGFKLRDGLFKPSPCREGVVFDHLAAGSGGLARIAELPPCRRPSVPTS